MKISLGRGCGVGCFAFIPIAFLVFGGFWLFTSIVRVSNQSTAIGVVVDVDQSRDSDGDISYRAVVDFVAADGINYRFTARTGSSSRPTVGDTIEVLYDPADPAGATEKTFLNLWLFPIMFGGFGLLFLVVMAFAVGRSRRKREVGGDPNAAQDLDDLLGNVARKRRDPDDVTSFGVPAEDSRAQASAPVGGATVEFRRAEASIAADGSMKYRIVAKDDAGNEYYSDLLDADPTVAIMRQGNRVQVVQRRDGWVVDFEMPEED